METSYLSCQIRDICKKCTLHIPGQSDHLWVIGLTVSEDLIGCDPGHVYRSDVVVTLFSLHTKKEGHWVTPHPDLPLILNGEQLYASSLLSHGSVLLVGGHTLSFMIDDLMGLNQVTHQPTTLAPPPKPKRGHVILDVGRIRNSEDSGEEQEEFIHDEQSDLPHILTAEYDVTSPGMLEEMERSADLLRSYKSSIVNNDLELLNHIDSPEQVLGVCMSYVIQFCVGNKLQLTSREVDELCKIINHIWLVQPQTLFEFLGNMKSKLVICEEDIGSFLKLFSDILLWSMDQESASEVCLKVITHLSGDPIFCEQFTDNSLIALISACMSVYIHNVQIQTLTCNLYANVLDEWKVVSKCPIKEAAVDFIVRAIEVHCHERPLLRAAFRALCSLLKHHELLKLNSQMNSTSVLDHINKHALPIVPRILKSHEDDVNIWQYCNDILRFYGEDVLEPDNSDVSDLDHGPTDELHIYDEIPLSRNNAFDKELETSSECPENDYIIVLSGENPPPNQHTLSHEAMLAQKRDLMYTQSSDVMYATVAKLNDVSAQMPKKSAEKTKWVNNSTYEQNVFPQREISCILESTDLSSGELNKDITKQTAIKEEVIDSSLDLGSDKTIPEKKTWRSRFGKYLNKLKRKNSTKSLSKTKTRSDSQLNDSTNSQPPINGLDNYVKFDQFDDNLYEAFISPGNNLTRMNSTVSDPGFQQCDMMVPDMRNDGPIYMDPCHDNSSVLYSEAVSSSIGRYDFAESAMDNQAMPYDETRPYSSVYEARRFYIGNQSGDRLTRQASVSSVESLYDNDRRHHSMSYKKRDSISDVEMSDNDRYYPQNTKKYTESVKKKRKRFSFSRRRSYDTTSLTSLNSSDNSYLEDTTNVSRRSSQTSHTYPVSIDTQFHASTNMIRRSSLSDQNQFSQGDPSQCSSFNDVQNISRQSSITSQNQSEPECFIDPDLQNMTRRLSQTKQYQSESDQPSDYCDAIRQSMEPLKRRKSGTWVGALKKLYEKPKNKLGTGLSSKSCSNLTRIGKRYSVVENPVYSRNNSFNDVNASPLPKLLPVSRSVDDFNKVKGEGQDRKPRDKPAEKENCQEKEEMTDDELAYLKDKQFESVKSRLSKFEQLKLKNKQTRYMKFPWHTNKDSTVNSNN